MEPGKKLVRARTGLCVVLAVLTAASSAQQTLPSGTIRTIALDPGDSHYVYVGGDDGVFYSHDSGQSWDRAQENMQVLSLSVNPGTEFRLEPEILAGTQSRGVLGSGNFGVTWNGDPGWTESIQSVSSRANGSAAYAGSETALYVSNEGGPGWEVLTDQLGSGASVEILTAPANSNLIYVAKYGQGVYRSTDRGVSWQLGSAGLGQATLTDLDVHPSNPSLLFATILEGIFQSSDAGTNWTSIPAPPAAYRLAIDPVTPGRIFAATSGSGMYRSTDGGQLWTAINNGLGSVMTFFSVAVEPSFAGRVYAGSQEFGLFASNDYGNTWQAIEDAPVPPQQDTPPDIDPTPSAGPTSLTLNIVDLQNGAIVEAGSPARYRLELRNTGANTAIDAELFASWVLTVLLVGDEPMSRTLVPSRGTCAPSGDCSFGDLEPGAFVSIDFSGATKATLGTYRLTVRYSAANTSQGSQSVTKGSSLAAADGGGGAFDLIGIAALLLLQAFLLLAWRRSQSA